MQDITDTTDIETGDIISKGMAEFEVVDIREEPDGFGPPFQATIKRTKELGDFGEKGSTETLGKGELLSGYEVID